MASSGDRADAKDVGTSMPSRRRFLQLVGTSSALGVLPACGANGGAAPQAFGDVAAGNISALSIGSLQAVPGAPAIIGRDSAGVYAMTSTCTHQGCNMNRDGRISSSGVVCTCHRSVFDLDGNPVSGPANASLQHFAVSIDVSGAITVHGGMAADQATRAAVSIG